MNYTSESTVAQVANMTEGEGEAGDNSATESESDSIVDEFDDDDYD